MSCGLNRGLTKFVEGKDFLYREITKVNMVTLQLVPEGFRCVSNLIIGSFHRLRLSFIFYVFRTRCVLNLKALALTSALQSRLLTLIFFHHQGLNKSSIHDL